MLTTVYKYHIFLDTYITHLVLKPVALSFLLATEGILSAHFDRLTLEGEDTCRLYRRDHKDADDD